MFPNIACITIGGEVSGKPCKFPWIYPINNITYLGCANPHKDSKGNWCPTEVNEAGEFVTKSGNWGYCSDNCPSKKSE